MSDANLQDSYPISREEFSSLAREHHRELLVYAHSLAGEYHGAEDILQEAFVTAYRMRGVFERDRDFGAWLRGITRFKYREWLRRQTRAPKAVTDLEVSQIDSLLDEWQAAVATEGASVFIILESCLGELPDAYQSAISAFYFESLPGSDAARTLGISGVTLRKRLQRARAGLMECIERKANPTELTPPVSSAV